MTTILVEGDTMELLSWRRRPGGAELAPWAAAAAKHERNPRPPLRVCRKNQPIWAQPAPRTPFPFPLGLNLVMDIYLEDSKNSGMFSGNS